VVWSPLDFADIRRICRVAEAYFGIGNGIWIGFCPSTSSIPSVNFHRHSILIFIYLLLENVWSVYRQRSKLNIKHGRKYP